MTITLKHPGFIGTDRPSDAAHVCSCTTKLYDRNREELTFEEVERIKI
jgi:hypothetical protein